MFETDVVGLSAALLGYLRRALERPDLAYAESPSQLALGTEARIYAFSLRGAPVGVDGPMVLRMMLSGKEQPEIVVEHAIQNALVGQGFPAPFVVASSPAGEALGAPFMVMTRLPGGHRPDLADAVRLQMEALAQLHSLEPEPMERSKIDHGVPAAQRTRSVRSGGQPLRSTSGALLDCADSWAGWSAALPMLFGPGSVTVTLISPTCSSQMAS